MSLSSCCGAAPRGNGDCDSSDFGICPDCGEHCDYYEDDDFDEDGNLIVKLEEK